MMKAKSTKFVLVIALVILGAAIAAPFLFDLGQLGLLGKSEESASPESMIQAYTSDKENIKLTIGVMKAGETNYKVIGEDSKELEPMEYEYEIGSISKTITASMLCKAVEDGLIDLNDPISQYLPLDPNSTDPTILSLATHTSGYGEYPFDEETLSEKEMIRVEQDFYEKKRNIYQGIKENDLIGEIRKKELKDKSYDWEYSNFGIAVLGAVLGEANHTSYQALAENFVAKDLGLAKTRFGDGTGTLGNYWEWSRDDAYLASAGFVSTVTDLLEYGRMHLTDSPEYLALSHKAHKTFDEEGLNMGLGWIIDPTTGFLWHNGGTSSYTSFIGIDKTCGTVVVILSNYPEKDGSEDDGALDTLGFELLDRLSSSEVTAGSVLE